MHVGVASSHPGNLGCALKPLACVPCAVSSAATVVRSAPSYCLVLRAASAVEPMSAATVVLSPAFLAHNPSLRGATHFLSSLSLTFLGLRPSLRPRTKKNHRLMRPNAIKPCAYQKEPCTYQKEPSTYQKKPSRPSTYQKKPFTYQKKPSSLFH